MDAIPICAHVLLNVENHKLSSNWLQDTTWSWLTTNNSGHETARHMKKVHVSTHVLNVPELFSTTVTSRVQDELPQINRESITNVMTKSRLGPWHSQVCMSRSKLQQFCAKLFCVTRYKKDLLDFDLDKKFLQKVLTRNYFYKSSKNLVVGTPRWPPFYTLFTTTNTHILFCTFHTVSNSPKSIFPNLKSLKIHFSKKLFSRPLFYSSMTFYRVSTRRFTTPFSHSNFLLLPVTSKFRFWHHVVPHAL